MQYERIISERISALARHFPAVVLTGARQSGKTTLLKKLFPEYSYVSLDSYQIASLAENEPELFLLQHSPPLVIDEVQYAPKLFRHLKAAIDKNREVNSQFILTGSQKFTLMKEVSDSLAGRVGLVELSGLCSEELGDVLEQALLRKSPQYVLSRGMFPELWEDQGIPHDEFYQSYLSTYIERDVRQILNISSLRDFDRFLRAAAARNGQLLNKTDIAKDVGVTAKTINDWLSVLVASNQITLLEPFFANIGKRLVKSPRLFFNDTGLLCHLLGLSQAALATYNGIGFIWESFVLGELQKLREAYSPMRHFWFYRDGAGKEVDVLVDYDGKLDLLEIKWTELARPSDESTLLDVVSYLEERVRSHILVCRQVPFSVTKQKTRVLNGFNLHSWWKS